MSARSRKRFDLGFGLLIYIASALVLLSVLGVFTQMVMVAKPLFVDRGLQPALDAAVPTPRVDQPSTPRWVPEHINSAAFATRPRSRIWVGFNQNGMLVGARGLMQSARNDRWVYEPLSLPSVTGESDGLRLFIDPSWHWLALLGPSGDYQLIALSDQTMLRESIGGKLDAHTAVATMPGGRSFLTWDDHTIKQWHWLPASGGKTPTISYLREVGLAESILQVTPAPTGQRVAILTEQPELLLWHTTSERIVDRQRLGKAPVEIQWLDDQRLSAEFSGRRMIWQLSESDGAVSLSTLLTPVHYEGYNESNYRWLPVAAADAEPKFSLVPLLWGTFKAAAVALLFAIPVGVGAAIFVGFFMSPRLRDKTKPIIELLAAFPSVVLGALTALLVAPHFIRWLPGILGAVAAVPIGVLTLSVIWRTTVTTSARRQVIGWLPLLLVPVVLILAWMGFAMGVAIDASLPGGSLVNWLETSLGVGVVHRNALLIGIAMGIATVPLIFSIAEDAIHSVPPVLAAGSLALGATHWQSYRDVVLPVAAPGIIAACMIGLGRAVGETMIVLLVASNTPIMEINLLEGLRSVSATLALELSEAPFESVHYRVLFAAGLALFLLTFVLNSLAEVVRLRNRQHSEQRR
ncbi:MAG: ABC transporter permease subunit [Halieaceae bacterium]|jgi:phosphate transport system permease protein|nr:ABC transporter permease subunit [Halieaceae bacterium]